MDVINPLMNSGFVNIKGFSSHSHLTFLTIT